MPKQEYHKLLASTPSSHISLEDWERATELVISRAFAISAHPGKLCILVAQTSHLASQTFEAFVADDVIWP